MTALDPIAREILQATNYLCFASVTEEGRPENIPLSFAFDDSTLYFRSPANTRHLQNILQQSWVSIVVMDTSQEMKGALYIHSTAKMLEGANRERAHNLLVERLGEVPSFWYDVRYFSVDIGVQDERKSIARMLYYEEGMTHEG